MLKATIRRPFGEVELCDQGGLEPHTVFHLFPGQSLLVLSGRLANVQVSISTGWEELGRVATREATTFESEGGKKVFLLGMDTHYVAAAVSFYTDDTRKVFAHGLI
jgi:hypothetical protein